MQSFILWATRLVKYSFLGLVLVCLIGISIRYSTLRSDLDSAKETIDSQNQELALRQKPNQAGGIADPQLDQFARMDTRIQELQPRLDSIVRKKIIDAVLQNCERYKLSPSLVIHLICRETQPKFNPLSRSTKGAIGLMQIMHKVHKKHNPGLAKLKSEELYHIDNNIQFGCQILRGYINTTKSLDEALKKYVGGEVKGYVPDIFEMMAEWEQGRYNGQKRTD